MKKTEELVSSNIALQGEFDPVKFDKLFFIKNDVFAEEDFEENSLFSKNAVSISTKEFLINITKKQIVIILKNNIVNIEKISKIITTLKNNYYFLMISFNQKWFKLNENINELTRTNFYPSKSSYLNEYFKNEDSAFGYYASKNLDNGRFKVDIKPITLVSVVEKKELDVLSFDFSFHLDKINDTFNPNQSLIKLGEESEKLIKSF